MSLTAIVSDIHGNLAALQAALEEIEARWLAAGEQLEQLLAPGADE